jgi:pilus assembly protein CpaB
MNRQRGWILLSLGLILALGTGIAVFFLLRQQQQAVTAQALARAAEQSPPVVTLQLPVAARPLTPGTTLTAEDFQLKDFPADLVPAAAITTSISLENQVLAEPVGQGETFSVRQLAGENAERLSRQLPAGQVAYAFPVEDLLSQIQVVEPGDRVDILITIPVETPDAAGNVISTEATGFTLQNVLVFDIIRPGSVEDNNPPVALLLSVSPEDAVMIKHARDSKSQIDLVLRSVLDQDPFDVPAVTRDDLITRYGLR